MLAVASQVGARRLLDGSSSNDGLQGIKITVSDKTFPLCQYNYNTDELNKFCAYYGGLPYHRLAKGPAYQSIVTVENTDK